METTFAYRQTLTFDADTARCTWRLPASRQWGDAEVFVARGAAAWDANILRPGGGFLVRLYDPSGGPWTGIAVETQFDRRGCTVKALELAALTSTVLVERSVTLDNLTGGTLARRACTNALGGAVRGLIRPGTFAEAAPFLPEYQFSTQPLSDVLGDLCERTGQEWRVNADGTLDWLPAFGRTIDTHVCEGVSIVDVSCETPLDGAAVELVARGSDGHEYLAATNEDAGLWRRQVAESVDTRSPVALGMLARDRLTTQRVVPITYRFKLAKVAASASDSPVVTLGFGIQPFGTSPFGGVGGAPSTVTLGSVREGDTLLIHVPSLGIGSAAVRVVARTIDAQSAWIDVEAVATEGVAGLPQAVITAVATPPVAPPSPVDTAAVIARARRLRGAA